jgi:hypothetical protein
VLSIDHGVLHARVVGFQNHNSLAPSKSIPH